MTEPGVLPGVDYRIAYGKEAVPVYRHYATPLAGIPQVPESSFSGRDNVMFANEVTVQVHGDNFLPAYTRGDNSDVVATDSMKNFILSQAGGTRARPWRATSPARQRVPRALRADAGGPRERRELPFSVFEAPGGQGFGPSPVLRQRQWSDHSVAELRSSATRRGGTRRAPSGRVSIELLKTKGSAFTRFVRDEYTTLPERSDRPLFIRPTCAGHTGTRATPPGPSRRATLRASRPATCAPPFSTSS